MAPRRGRSTLALAGALALAGCLSRPAEGEAAPGVSRVAVERFRAEALVRALALDTALAALGRGAAPADSAAAATQGGRLAELRRARRTLQTAIDSLRPADPAAFDSARREIDGALDALGRQLAASRTTPAPTPADSTGAPR